ncbi:hypothetical protein PR048_013819, partial [Dryococelus australis]
MFPGHVVSMHDDIGWPPHSSDLTPCDICFSQVYRLCSNTLDELKAAITHEVATIALDITCRVIDNHRERLNMCIKNGGRHLTDVIFK